MNAKKLVDDDANRVFVRNRDTVTRKISGETFVLGISGELANMDRMYALDEVGEVIWNRLAQQASLEEVVDAVTERFEVDPETARKDAREFLERLVAMKLLKEESER